MKKKNNNSSSGRPDILMDEKKITSNPGRF